jgi:hypothetical protein
VRPVQPEKDRAFRLAAVNVIDEERLHSLRLMRNPGHSLWTRQHRSGVKYDDTPH